MKVKSQSEVVSDSLLELRASDQDQILVFCYLLAVLVISPSGFWNQLRGFTEEPGGLQSMELLESDMTERLHFHFSLSCIGGGNGNPLQCSCPENPKDRGAW